MKQAATTVIAQYDIGLDASKQNQGLNSQKHTFGGGDMSKKKKIKKECSCLFLNNN